MNETARTTLAPLRIPLILEEAAGIQRISEPVTVGIPFPQGAIHQPAELGLLDAEDRLVPVQTQVLDRWRDQSVKWVLFDFQATVAAHTTACYTIRTGDLAMLRSVEERSPVFSVPMTVEKNAARIVVQTGAATFFVNAKVFVPFEQVVAAGTKMLADSGNGCQFIRPSAQNDAHVIRKVLCETEGPLRITLRIEGELRSQDHREADAVFWARLHFYANSPIARIDYTIRNPNAAKHPGGLWDLGDESSIYFKDLALHLNLAAAGTPLIQWTTQPDRPFAKGETGKIVIYQDSSGGENWQSSNHVNRFGQVMHRFRGYQVSADKLVEEGLRAQPLIAVCDGTKRITGAVRKFWENFPKALEAVGPMLSIRLFPGQYQDGFELQGGEQKTHTVFLSFERLDGAQDSVPPPGSLNWINTPLLPHASPEWYFQSHTFPYLTPAAADPRPDMLALINCAIEGDHTFFARREMIDEYGWRNFGDLFADHETIYYKGEGRPISHYNNQYDCIYAFLLQYVRSGNSTWFTLANDLAQHVIDIDIYHTTQDKAAYNGGLFWHTFHYLDAGTATHRSFSGKTKLTAQLNVYGGGHSNEHNYTTGLKYHYYLTGDPESKATAVGLADWVIDMDDGAQTKFKFLNRRATGYASMTASFDYHGPGRGAGYSINALLDAYLLTRQQRYLVKAEQLIQRCIHPQDNIAARDLLNLELRWSYVVFLQVLGRYLDLKVESGECDQLYCYARESLRHYAQWMREHERCSSTAFDQVNYPTETWLAQDLRKGNVFLFAAKYSQEPLRSAFLAKARFFFEQPLAELLAFETRTLTRPMVLLMGNSLMPAYFDQHPEEAAPQLEGLYDFGQPLRFEPQLYYAYKLRDRLSQLMSAIRKVVGKEWREPIK